MATSKTAGGPAKASSHYRRRAKRHPAATAFLVVTLLVAVFGVIMFFGWADASNPGAAGKKKFLIVVTAVLSAVGAVLSFLTGTTLSKTALANHPALRWLHKHKPYLVQITAACVFIQPAVSGWKDMISDPVAVTLNISFATRYTVARLVNIIPMPRPGITIPVSTELDVTLESGISAATATLNAVYHGLVANDVLVAGSSSPAIPRGTPVSLRVVPGGSALGIELIQVSVKGKSYSTSTEAGSSARTGAILRFSSARDGDRARRGMVGGAVGAVAGALFGRKGAKRETAAKGAAVGFNLGQSTAEGGGSVQSVNAIGQTEVIAFRLRQPLVLR